MRTFFLAFYLAIKEIVRNKGRFLLVSLVIALITLLVLFIAALGEGLADGNRQYVANLDAQLIVFLEKSDYSITSSRLETNTSRAVRRVEGVADAGPIYTSTSEIVSLPEPLKISMLAAEPDKPGMPPLIEGRSFRGGEASEAVIDEGVALRTDIKVGDEIEIRSTQGTKDEFFYLKVVGLVGKQSYFFQPTIFVPAATWEKMRPQPEADLNDSTPYPNIIAVKLQNPAQVELMKERLLAQVTKIEVADIPDNHQQHPRLLGPAEHGADTGRVYALDRYPGDRRFLPDPGAAKGATDRRAQGDRLVERRGWAGSGHPNHCDDSHWRRHRRRADLSLLAGIPAHDTAGLQRHTLIIGCHRTAVDRPVGWHGLDHLRCADRTAQSVEVGVGDGDE